MEGREVQHQTGHEQTGAPEFPGGNAVTGSFATWIREIVAGDAASDGHGGLDGRKAIHRSEQRREGKALGPEQEQSRQA